MSAGGLRPISTEPGTHSGGFVNRNENGKYRLCTGILQLAGVVLSSLNIHEIAQPSLDQLAAESNETATLAIWDEGVAVIVDDVLSDDPVKHLAPVGRRNPAHCTATGKILLASKPPAVIKAVLRAGLEAFTPHTIVEPKRLHAELEEVRQKGVAFCREEHRDGVNAVAAPIRDHEGNVIAAISVSGPSYRMSNARLADLGNLVKSKAEQISAKLGYRRSSR